MCIIIHISIWQQQIVFLRLWFIYLIFSQKKSPCNCKSFGLGPATWMPQMAPPCKWFWQNSLIAWLHRRRYRQHLISTTGCHNHHWCRTSNCDQHWASDSQYALRADGGASHIGVDDAAVTLTVSEIGVDQGINKPDAVVANRQWQEPADSCLVRCSSTLQCALEAKVGFDHSLEADAHHITEILGITVLCLQRQWGDGNSRSQQSNGKAEEALIRAWCRALLVCACSSHHQIEQRFNLLCSYIYLIIS